MDKAIEIVFLGTGSAEGIPSMGCDCGHCQRARREGGRLKRERSAILLKLPGYQLLIDTPQGCAACSIFRGSLSWMGSTSPTLTTITPEG